LFRSTSAEDPQESSEYQKTVTASVVPEFITETDWLRVVLLTLLAVLGPFLILYGLNFLNKKIDVGPGAVVTLPVSLVAGRLYRRNQGDNSDLAIKDDDLDIVGMPPPGGYRSVDIGGVEFSGKMPWSPFADTYGVASTGSAQLIVANHGTDPRHPEIGRLGPTLKGAWVFRTDTLPTKKNDEYEPIDGILTLIVPSDPDSARSLFVEQRQQIEDLLNESCRRYSVDPPGDPASNEDSSTPSEQSSPFGQDSSTDESLNSYGPIDPLTGQVLPSRTVEPDEPEDEKKSRRWRRPPGSPDDLTPPAPPNPPNLPF
jgi:hypothetical protein